MEIEYRLLEQISEEEQRAMGELYKAVGWIAPEDPIEFIAVCMANSAAAVGAYAEGRLIGMGRALSDNVSDAYIQDIAVSPEFRRHGIGAGIVRKLIEILRKRGVDWISLVGEPGTESFYRGLGFEPKSDYTFWKLP